MAENNFWIDLIATLKKTQSKKQVQSDAKNLGDIKVPLVGTLNKTKTKAQLKQDLASLNGTINLTGKVNQKGIVTSVQQATKQAQTTANKNTIQVSMNLKKDKLINDIKVFGQQNTKLFKDANMAAKYNSLLDNAKLATSSKEIQNLRLQLSAMRSEIKATNLSGLTLGDTFKKTFKRATELFTGTGGVMLLTQQMRQAWTEALNLDKAYTDLIKVQDELSRGDYPTYLEQCNKKAQELAATQQALIEGATEFSKSGYTRTESDALTEKSTILANVGDMSASDSAKAIISGVQAYDIVDGYDDVIDKAGALIDKYNEIGNTASITTAEIAQGVQSVGSVFADANTSVDEFIALLAAGNRQYQDADSLALGLRTSALRIRGCTAELEMMGEETEGVYTSASKLADKIEGLTNINGNGGVKILEADGETFRSIYDIFLDISKVYQQMSDTDQSALLELIAGKHRASAISATLNNMSEAQEIYQNSLEASGSAQREYDKYLESSEAALNKFKASMTETYQSVIDGQTVTGLLNCGNATLQFVNSLGLVESTLKGLVAIGIVKAITTLSTAFKASTIQASNFGTALNTVKSMSTITRGTTEYTNALKTLKTVSAGLSETQLKQVLASKALSDSDRIAILCTTGLTKAQAQAKLAQMGLTQSTKAQTTANASATASTFSLTAAVKGFGVSLKAAFMNNPVGISIMALSTIIGAVSSKVSEYNEKLRETRQANMDAATSAKEKADSLRELYVQYENLSGITNRTSSQEEQFKQVVIDITKALGDKASALEGLTAGQNDYTEALKEATKAELESQYATAKIGAKAAEEELKDKTYDSWSGSQITIQQNEQMTGVKEHVAALEAVKDILAEYEDIGTYGIEWEPVNWDSNKDDMNAVVEYYNALIEARNKLATADNADFLMSSDIYEDINNTVNDLSESVEKYTEQQYNALKLNYEWQNGVPSTEEEFHKMEESILDASGAGQEFQEVLKGYLAEDFSTFSNSINNIENGIDDVTEYTKTMTDEVSNAKDSLEDIIKQYPELVKMATVGKLDEDVLTSTEQYADLLAKVGLSADSSSSDIKKLVEQIQAVADDNMIDNLKKMSDDFESLDDAYNTLMNKKESLSIDDLDKVQNVFGDLDVFDEWVAKVTDSKASTEELQKAFDNLATEYLNKSKNIQSTLNGLVNADKSTIQTYIANLKAMGITNAEELINNYITAINSENQLIKDAETELLNGHIQYVNGKMQLDTDYLNDVSSKNSTLVSSLGSTYQNDYNNWANLLTQKVNAYNEFVNAIKGSQLNLGSGSAALSAKGQAQAIIDNVNKFGTKSFTNLNSGITGLLNTNSNASYTQSEYEAAKALVNTYKQYEAASDALKIDLANVNTNFGSTYSPSSSSGSSHGSDSPSTKETESTIETFDFIETLIDRLEKKIGNYNTKAENTARSFSYRMKKYKKEIKAVSSTIGKLKSSYDTYKARANSVGLETYWKKKVQNGAINISDIDDEGLKERISEYQKWYEKALSVKEKITELEQTQTELNQSKLELLITRYEKLAEKVSNVNERIQNKIDLKESWGGSASVSNYTTMNKNIRKQISYITKQNTELKNLQKTVTKGSEAWYEYNERINSNNSSLQDLKKSMVENAKTAAELAKIKADTKVEKYDSKDELYDAKIDNASTASSKNSLINNKISNVNKRQNSYNNAVSTDKKNIKTAKNKLNKFKKTKANKTILKDIKKYTKNSKRIPTSLLNKAYKLNDNGKLYDACVQYNAYIDAYTSDKEIADLFKETSKQEKRDLAIEQVQNIADSYDIKLADLNTVRSMREAIDSKMKASGISQSKYSNLIQISNSKSKQSQLQSKHNEMQAKLNEMLQKGYIKRTDAQYKEMRDTINALNIEIMECVTEQIAWNKEIDNMDLTNLGALADIIDNLESKLSNLVSLTESHGHSASDSLLVEQIEAAQTAINNSDEKISKYIANLKKYATTDIDHGGWGLNLTSTQAEYLAKLAKTQDVNGIKEFCKQLGIEYGQYTELQEIISNIADEKNSKLSSQISQEELYDSLLQKRIDSLNNIIDALDEINNKRDRALTLEKAMFNLEKAKNNLSQKVWNGTEWIYDADHSAIKDAQESLDDVKFEELKNVIQDVIDAIEKLMKENNMYNDDGSVSQDLNKVLETVRTLDAELFTFLIESLNEKYPEFDWNSILEGTNIKINNATIEPNSNLVPIETSSLFTSEQVHHLTTLLNGNNALLNYGFDNLCKNIENISNDSNHSQIINQEFHVSMPNITDSSKADQLIKEFERLSTARVQYFNKKK